MSRSRKGTTVDRPTAAQREENPHPGECMLHGHHPHPAGPCQAWPAGTQIKVKRMACDEYLALINELVPKAKPMGAYCIGVI
jgi:hypothetical protein